MAKEILILGNPLLRARSEEVVEFSSDEAKQNIAETAEALEEFRNAHGFGRGIAAIQIGIQKRIIALNLGEQPFAVINPRITGRSEETFRMWDDCMSFPDLFVRVKRHTSIDIEYQDENGEPRVWSALDQAASELLQHEIDHLDGILAVDRAISENDIIYKSEYERNRGLYDGMVDYRIRSTIRKKG